MLSSSYQPNPHSTLYTPYSLSYACAVRLTSITTPTTTFSPRSPHHGPQQVMKRIDSDVSAHHTVSSPKLEAVRALPSDEPDGEQGEAKGRERGSDGIETVSEPGGAFKYGVSLGGMASGELTAARGSFKKSPSLGSLGKTSSLTSMSEDEASCDTKLPTELDREKLSGPPVVRKRPTLFSMASLRSLSGRDLRSSWGKTQVT